GPHPARSGRSGGGARTGTPSSRRATSARGETGGDSGLGARAGRIHETMRAGCEPSPGRGPASRGSGRTCRGRRWHNAVGGERGMSAASLAQYGAFLLIVTLLVRPVGGYLARVFGGERTWLDAIMRPLERVICRLAGVDPTAEMDWKHYAGCFLVFGLGGTLLLYAILRMQPLLHTFDPAYRPGPLPPDLAMNTAISFATTTTW